MHSVDAFVFPSRYEAMSLSLLEAMAAGLPVVTARTAGGAEIITPECGIVLDDPDDPKALPSAVARLADNDDARRAMGVAANQLATGFGWARMAAQYIALYRQLAGQQKDRRRSEAEAAVVAKTDALTLNTLAGQTDRTTTLRTLRDNNYDHKINQIAADRDALVSGTRGRPRPHVLLAGRRIAGRGRRGARRGGRLAQSGRGYRWRDQRFWFRPRNRCRCA